MNINVTFSESNQELYTEFAEQDGSFGVGFDGVKTIHGEDGASAYEIALEHGFEGSEEEWLDSLHGEKGEKGDPGPKGDKGDTGATGPAGATGATGPKGDKGDKGDTGDKGEKGDTGATGAQGIQGPKGDTGATGPKGDKGDKGDTGSGFKVLGYYASLAALQAAVPSPNIGDAYGIGTAQPYDIYIYGGASGWVNNGPLQGAKGDTGPQGPQGDKGDKGDKGDTGADGPEGPAGYTPVKGTDYWTAADKAAMVNDVLAALPAAEGVSF